MSDEATKRILEQANRLAKEWERQGKTRDEFLEEFGGMMGVKHKEKEVGLHFDDNQAALGYVGLRRNQYGAELVVNGRVVGLMDLFYVPEGQPPQLVVDSMKGGEEPVAKVVFEPNRAVVVVSDQLSHSLLKESYAMSKGDSVFVE